MCTCFVKSVFFHVLIEARVIVFRDNAEFVLFSFAWVKPALGRFLAVTGVDRFSHTAIFLMLKS
jgi:hypothetical protein